MLPALIVRLHAAVNCRAVEACNQITRVQHGAGIVRPPGGTWLFDVQGANG
jgi:hypothetical protein